jgi:hypothetical protein
MAMMALIPYIAAVVFVDVAFGHPPGDVGCWFRMQFKVDPTASKTRDWARTSQDR